MALWKSHRKWAKRFLEWGNLDDPAGDPETLVDFPKEKGFILKDHDFNRRPWRDFDNKNMIYNVFGEKGLLLMDLHYCLDFLKEKTDPQILKQKWKVFPQYVRDEDLVDIHPSVINLARSLAIKVKDLNIDKKVFKFTIVNFREILSDLVSEHGYGSGKLKEWNNSSFNRIMKDLEIID